MFGTETADDNKLVRKFSEGDQQAIELLIKRHKDRVCTYL